MLKIGYRGLCFEIHFTFLLLLFIFLFLGNGMLAFFSVIFSFLHECTHAYTARRLGYTPVKILIGLFGGVLQVKEGYIPRDAELLIDFSGPFFNLCIAMASYMLFLLTRQGWIYCIISSNMILALFNLLPLYPLDGGKIINIYLSRFWGYEISYLISKTFSHVFSVLLFILGLYLVQYNIVNLLICALAVNLYIAGREDSKYSFERLMCIYTKLEKGNRI